jgi:hypothetical protein
LATEITEKNKIKSVDAKDAKEKREDAKKDGTDLGMDCEVPLEFRLPTVAL